MYCSNFKTHVVAMASKRRQEALAIIETESSSFIFGLTEFSTAQVTQYITASSVML
jgi:hypothetical protein